jgi:hypothetical protein
MGVWGSGLYSGDFALDLRNTIKALVRLPLDGQGLLQLLCDLDGRAADNPENEDYTTFWLVAADQFVKYGIRCDRARQRAFEIIDSGSDVAMLKKLGMDLAGLQKRQKMLAALRQSLAAGPQAAKGRSVITSPQPLVMEVGDVFVYPTSLGRCKIYRPALMRVVPPWEQDGWNAAIIADSGHAFGFLAWYRPLTLPTPLNERPDLARLRSASSWILRGPGTASAVDLKRLGLEKIGRVPVDSEKLQRSFPSLPSGANAAINDRRIERELSVGSHVGETFISVRALQKAPGGLARLPDLIREATERYEKLRPMREKEELGTRREPAISNLDEILS